MGSRRITIVEADISHVYQLARALRAEDAGELEAAGLVPERGVRASFRSALIRRTAFVDGNLAAMFGMGGIALGDVGHPWLLTTPAIERAPVEFVREARNVVGRMLQLKPVLVNYVDARYLRACRFVALLGFVLEPPAPFGPLGAQFRRFEARREWGLIQSR